MINRFILLFFIVMLCFISKLSSTDPILKQEIREALALRSAEDFKIERITTGASDSIIYKVFLEKKTLIARFLNSERALHERSWEINIMEKTSALEISPHVSYASPNKDLVIMDYVEGKNFDKSFSPKPHLLKSLAKKLRSLHTLPIEEQTPNIESLESRLFVKSNTKEYQHFLSSFRALENEFLEASTLSITHTDLHPGNLLVNENGIWIIDWQDAGIYGPMYDLSNISIELQLHEEDEAVFLSHYFDTLELSHAEKENYIRAKKIAGMKIIDSMMYRYLQNFSDKDAQISQLFMDAQKDFSQEENMLIAKILNNDADIKITDNINYFRLAILYLLKQ